MYNTDNPTCGKWEGQNKTGDAKDKEKADSITNYLKQSYTKEKYFFKIVGRHSNWQQCVNKCGFQLAKYWLICYLTMDVYYY